MKAIVAIAILALVISPVHAQLGSQSFGNVDFNNPNITQNEIDVAESDFSDPGMLPDSPFYFFKRFGEGMRLAFANDAEKEKLHLEFAKTRLAEAKKLSEENKHALASEYIKEFNMEIQHINSTDNETQAVLQKSRIVLTIVLENVPENAQPAIQSAIENAIAREARGNSGEIENGNRMMQQMRDKIKERMGEQNENAAEQIADAEEKIAEAEQYTNNTNTTGLIDLAKEKLANAKDAYNQTKYGEAYGQANAAEQLAKNAIRQLENDENDENESDDNWGCRWDDDWTNTTNCPGGVDGTRPREYPWPYNTTNINCPRPWMPMSNWTNTTNCPGVTDDDRPGVEGSTPRPWKPMEDNRGRGMMGDFKND